MGFSLHCGARALIVVVSSAVEHGCPVTASRGLSRCVTWAQLSYVSSVIVSHGVSSFVTWAL